MPRNKLDKPQIFCIGWHKTGTTTMGLALLELGYTVLGARLDMAKPLMAGEKSIALQLAGEFDALQDVPWAALFKDLDETYPGSKFILTVRDEAAWLNSATKHFNDSYIQLHEWLYTEGVLLSNEELYLARYRKHYKNVAEYFAGRDDLLVMDFSAGDGWIKLCNFLDEPIPLKAFPHANKGKHNYNWKDKSVATLRSMVPWPLRKARIAVLETLGLHRGWNRFNNHYENRGARENKR